MRVGVSRPGLWPAGPETSVFGFCWELALKSRRVVEFARRDPARLEAALPEVLQALDGALGLGSPRSQKCQPAFSASQNVSTAGGPRPCTDPASTAPTAAGSSAPPMLAALPG